LETAETFFCGICFEECNIQDIMYIKCNHYFCKPCFKEYFEYHINSSGTVFLIKCPDKDCEQKIYEQEIRILLREDTFKKFKKLRLNYEVSRSKNKKFCPYPECDGVAEK